MEITPALPGRDTPSVLAAYDLSPPVESFALAHLGANNLNTGLHTAAGDFIMKTYASMSYDDPASIAYEHDLLEWLGRAGLSFAVPVPLPARDGTLVCRGPRGFVSLVSRLPGACLDPRRPDHVELLGAALGELQAVLQLYPLAPRPGRPLFGLLFAFPPAERDPLTLTPAQLGLPDVPPYDALLGWWREEADRLQEFVAGPYRALPVQLCHNDVTPNNVLVAAGRVSAVLDFEYAAPTPRAPDVAMGLRMTMHIWENASPWEAVNCFCRGYRRHRRLTEAEVVALPQLSRLRAAITVLWWLGRTAPGEAGPIPDRVANLRRLAQWLDRNEHSSWTRCCERLCEFKVSAAVAGLAVRAHRRDSGQPVHRRGHSTKGAGPSCCTAPWCARF